MMEDEEESRTDANNVISDALIHASSSPKENADTIFTSDKLDKSDKLVNTLNNLKINDARHELKKFTTNDKQGNLTSNPDTVTHASNRMLDGKLFRCQIIREVPVQTPPANLIILTPHKLMMPAVKKIFAEATPGNAWTNRTPRQVIKIGFNGTTLGNIGHIFSISEIYSPDLIGIVGATVPPCGLNVRH